MSGQVAGSSGSSGPESQPRRYGPGYEGRPDFWRTFDAGKFANSLAAHACRKFAPAYYAFLDGTRTPPAALAPGGAVMARHGTSGGHLHPYEAVPQHDVHVTKRCLGDVLAALHVVLHGKDWGNWGLLKRFLPPGTQAPAEEKVDVPEEIQNIVVHNLFRDAGPVLRRVIMVFVDRGRREA